MYRRGLVQPVGAMQFVQPLASKRSHRKIAGVKPAGRTRRRRVFRRNDRDGGRVSHPAASSMWRQFGKPLATGGRAVMSGAACFRRQYRPDSRADAACLSMTSGIPAVSEDAPYQAMKEVGRLPIIPDTAVVIGVEISGRSYGKSSACCHHDAVTHRREDLGGRRRAIRLPGSRT